MKPNKKSRAVDAPLDSKAISASENVNRGMTAILSQTPDSNTGLNSQTGFTVGVDWLDITFRDITHATELDAIINETEVMLNDVIDFSPYRQTYNGRNWDGSGRGQRGTLLFYDSGVSTDGGENQPASLKVVASGSVVSTVEQSSLAEWINGRLLTNKIDCTRLDIALDDHEKVVPLWKITEARERGNFFNALHSTYIESGKRGHDKGITLYFGSPSSDKRLCIYDKSIESSNRINGNRWEGRFRRKAAKEALLQWLHANADGACAVVRWCSSVVAGLIDFRNRSSNDPNRFRNPSLLWYIEFIDRLKTSPIRIRTSTPVIHVQKSIDWVIKSVAPSLSLLQSVLSTDFPSFIKETIREGGERLSLKRRELIDITDKSKLIF